MIDRRQALLSSITLASFVGAAPALACRVPLPEFRTPSGEQIIAIVDEFAGGNTDGKLRASEGVRADIKTFGGTFANSSEPAALITPIVHKLYEEGDTEVFLVNFRRDELDLIRLDCRSDARNRHAILSFYAGELVAFDPMPIFDGVRNVELS